MCQHVPACGKVPAHADTSRCQHRCRHIYMPTHLRADSCWHMNLVWKLRYADMCQHLEGADTWEGAVTCRHMQVLTHADTCDISHMDFIWMLGCAGTCRYLDVSSHVDTFSGVGTFIGADTSQLPYKKVHMINITRVGTCWHTDVSASAGPCRHLSRCQQLFQSWHMSAHSSIQIKSIWLVSQMSACVGTCWHLDVLACAGSRWHLPWCRHLFRCSN